MEQKKEIPKQQKIALAVLGVIGLYMLYTNYYAPMGDRIISARENLSKKESQLAEMRIKAADIGVLEEELRLLEEQLEQTQEKLPHSEELSGFIRLITETALKYNIDVNTLVMSGVQSERYYSSHMYGMNLTSDYHTFAGFFSEIGQLERIFNIRNLSLALAEDDGSGTVRLSASFQIASFAFNR